MQSQAIGKSSKRHSRSTASGNAHPSTISYGTRTCPVGKMPLSAHKEAGRLLKEVHVATMLRYNIGKHLNVARFMAEDWAAPEYPDLSQEAFLNLYYFRDNGPNVNIPHGLTEEERARHIASVLTVKEIFVTHSPNCEPLRTLLKKLHDVVKALEASACRPPFNVTSIIGSKNSGDHPPKSSRLVVSVDMGGGTAGGRYRTYLLGTAGWARTLWAGDSDLGPVPVTDRKLYRRVARDFGDPETYRGYRPEEAAEHLLAKSWENEIAEGSLGEPAIVTLPGLLREQDIRRIERGIDR